MLPIFGPYGFEGASNAPGNLQNSYILGLANGQGVGEQSPSKPRCVACGKMMLTEPLFQGERQA